MKSIGIDIGSSSLKIVQVQSTNKGVQVLSYAEHPLGLNPAHDPELEILEFLQNLAQQIDPSQTKVVLAIRQDRVSVRLKTFPFKDRLKILKSLPFELEEDLPFSTETAIYDAKTSWHQGPSAEVLACATPKHRLSELLGRVQSSGLPITQITAEGIAFSNCFEAWDAPIPEAGPQHISLNEEAPPPRRLKLVIQIGHSHCLVNAFDESRLVGSRSVLWGIQNVAESISRKYELPLIDAMNEVRTKAFILTSKEGASYDQIVFSDTILNSFKELGKELRLSMLEFETQLGGKVLSADITGGGAGIINLGACLTQCLEVPVNRSNFLNQFSTLFERNPALENSIGVALGLALEGLRKPRNPGIQFLRNEFAPKNDSLEIFWESWGKTIQVTAGLIFVFFIYASLRESTALSLADKTKDTLKNQGQALAGLSAKQSNPNNIKKFIRDKRKRAQDMKSLEGLSKMNSALDVLKKLSDSVPARTSMNLVVHKFQIEETRALIQGTVANAQEKGQLEKALMALAKDGKLTSRQFTPEPSQLGIGFGYEFTVDRFQERAN